MNKSNHPILLLTCMLMLSMQLNAQLSTAPLGSRRIEPSSATHLSPERSGEDTLQLPFVDDFSYKGPHADPQKWINGGAFINSEYPINPPSWGVATFDGLNASGLPYSTQLVHGAADTLTSLPIDLNYLPSDSIYLSFSLQAKGRGNYPEYVDTFMLEFKTPADTAWRWAWSTKGEDFPQVQKPFRKVMVPIRDTSLLKRGFQFRFRNYAQLNGSWDHWHLDYVRLDKNRFRNDTLVMDYAFMYPASSLLDVYQSMPLSHFLVNPVSRMSEMFNLSLSNNTAAPLTRLYGYSFYNQFGTLVDGLANKTKGPVPPFEEFVFSEPTKYTYQNPGQGYEYATFDLWHMLNSNSEDVLLRNDTVRYFQILSNYYALDDGTAEERIGMENESGGFIAQRFEIYKSDTLKALQYFFNAVNDGKTDRPFYLSVWAAGSNQPGSLLYSQGPVQPTNDGWNKYTTYPLDQGLFLPAGSYYFGWSQENGTSLNLGFDRNIQNNSRIYYNQTGFWHNYVAQEGTLMIRPMFGKASDTYVGLNKDANRDLPYSVSPNPASTNIRLWGGQQGSIPLCILDLGGRVVYSDKQYHIGSDINLNHLPSGLYLIRLDDNRNPQTLRLSVVKP